MHRPARTALLTALALVVSLLTLAAPASAATAPSYELLSPVAGERVWEGSTYVVVRAHGYGAHRSKPELVVDGALSTDWAQEVPVPGTDAVDLRFWWTYDWPSEPTAHTLVVRDPAGVVPSTPAVTVTVDMRRPTVVITPPAPAGETIAVVTGEEPLTAEVTSAHPVDRVEFSHPGGEVFATATQAPWSVPFPAHLPQGHVAVRAEAFDVDGAWSWTERTYYLHTDGEPASLEALLDDGAVIGGLDFPLEIASTHAASPFGGQAPQALLDGEEVPLPASGQVVSSSDDGTHTVARYPWDLTGVADGEYDLVVRDRNGVVPDTAPVRVRVDNDATTVSWVGIRDGDVVRSGQQVQLDVQSSYAMASGSGTGLLDELQPGTPWSSRLGFDGGNGEKLLAASVEDVNGIRTAAPSLKVLLHDAVSTVEVCDGAPEDGFTDVPSSNAHEAAVDCAVALGLAKGRGVGTYEPSLSVNRGQMATFIARLLEPWLPEPDPELDVFADDDGTVHEDNIELLAEFGVVGGYADGTYRPERPVNRAQMASFLARAVELAGSADQGYAWSMPTAQADYFVDDADPTHGENIGKVAQAGIALGGAGRTYSPSNLVSRDQMASFLVRAVAVTD